MAKYAKVKPVKSTGTNELIAQAAIFGLNAEQNFKDCLLSDCADKNKRHQKLTKTRLLWNRIDRNREEVIKRSEQKRATENSGQNI
jgi:predicted Rossmann fold nucleotide-binding protein DprA/Smf involved in DNA uptake